MAEGRPVPDISSAALGHSVEYDWSFPAYLYEADSWRLFLIKLRFAKYTQVSLFSDLLLGS